MKTALYPFQVERISFFENDALINLQVRFFDDPLYFAGDILVNSSQLNRIVNELMSFGLYVMEQLTRSTSETGLSYYEIDLRGTQDLPILDMPELLSEKGILQIRA